MTEKQNLLIKHHNHWRSRVNQTNWKDLESQPLPLNSVHKISKEWRKAWLSCGITWLNVGDDPESSFWEHARIREAVGEAYESFYYTPVT